MAKLGDFTKIHLGDKDFIHSEGFRKPNQVAVFGAAMGLAGACSGAGVQRSIPSHFLLQRLTDLPRFPSKWINSGVHQKINSNSSCSSNKSLLKEAKKDMLS